MKAALTHKVQDLYAPKRIDVYLTQALEGRFSRQELKKLLDLDQVTFNGKIARPRDLVYNGDVIVAFELPAEGSYQIPAEDIDLKVLFEDASMLVIEKPVGMIVHPGAGNQTGTLVNALLGRNVRLSSVGPKDRPGIVHRLDKDTSGILLVAKTDAAHRALQAQFTERSLFKFYLTLVRGRVEFDEGSVDQPIGRDPKILGKMAVSSSEKARQAQSHYRVLKRFKHTTLLEVRIITGRTHQIRVHMAHLGYPVVGDILYGRAKASERLCLHAARIEFAHPKTGKPMSFESPIPSDMAAVIDHYSKDK